MTYLDEYLIAYKCNDILKQQYLLSQHINDLRVFLNADTEYWLQFIKNRELNNNKYFALITNIYHNIENIDRSLLIKLLFLLNELSPECDTYPTHDEVLEQLYSFNCRLKLNNQGFSTKVLMNGNLILNKDIYRVRDLLKTICGIISRRINNADIYGWISESTHIMSFATRYVLSMISWRLSNDMFVGFDMGKNYKDTTKYITNRLIKYSENKRRILHQT